MFQPKDTDWLNEYKNKTPIYAVYKRPISELGTHADWKWGTGKRYSIQTEVKKESSDTQIKLTLKIITKDIEGHYIMIKGSIQEEDITIIYAQDRLKC